MENIATNSIRSPSVRGKKPRFSLPSGARRGKGILNQSLLAPSPSECDSQCTSTTLSSTDVEWMKIQRKLQESRNHQKEMNEQESYNEDECNRVISFGSPVQSELDIETIQKRREALLLYQQSSELDDEIEYLLAKMDALQENFQTMFSEITYDRIVWENESKQIQHKNPSFLYSTIQSLDLKQQDIVQWSSLMEHEIMKNMI